MIRCRFAPSPTGYLHIGNLRTAIFNYLFARQNNGKFLLRIEDTDKERSTESAIDVIFSGLKLMDMEYDGDVVFQSKNINRHKEVVNSLLDQGKAYKCFHTTEELDSIRKSNRKFKSVWRDVEAKDHPSNLDYVVRIKSPTTGTSSINDMVQGVVTINNTELDDMIILRSNGDPVYQLAVVVDDYDSKITHVIRGDDHLTNTFRQNMIYDALGWKQPTYAHLPLIMDETGKKVSKRSGAASIIDFIDMGYLPESMMNYLPKLGWSSDKEFLSKEDLIKEFDISKVGKSASRLDYKKLNFINQHWISQKSDADLLKSLIEIKNKSEYKDMNYPNDILINMIPSLKVRVKTLIEMLDMIRYIDNDWFNKFDNPLPEKLMFLNSELINKFFINSVNSFVDNDKLMTELKEFCEQQNCKLKDVAAYIRHKLCKNKISPPLDVVIKSLTLDEIKRRINE